MCDGIWKLSEGGRTVNETSARGPRHSPSAEEVHVNVEDGLPRVSAIRCDFLMLMFKRKLTQFVARLSTDRVEELDHALQYALELPV